MPIDMDLGGVASAGTPLPEGEYIFEIVDATCKKAGSGKGGYNFRMRLEVTEDNSGEVGRVHLENINIQESTRPFVKAFITKWTGLSDDEVTRMTFDINDPEDPEGYDESIPDFTVRTLNDLVVIGSRIGGTLKHKEENGTVYGNIVAWHNV